MPSILKLDYYTTITRLEDTADHLQQPIVQVVDFDTKEQTIEGVSMHRLDGSSEAIIKDLVDCLSLALATAEICPAAHEITAENSKKILERTLSLRSMVYERV